MAIKGLSKLVIAPAYQYDSAANKVTYGPAAVTEKMAEYKADISFTEDDGLYLDNSLAEKAPGKFSSGSLTVTTGELTNETSKMILDIKEITQTVDSKSVKGLAFDKNTKGNTTGIGLIEEHQLNNEDFYRAVILTKVAWDVPSDAATTRQDKISWQTKEIGGTIMESDEKATSETETDKLWKATFDLPTEAEALATILAYFADHERADA